MKEIRRAFDGSRLCSAKSNVLIVVVIAIFCGMLGGVPAAKAQGTDQTYNSGDPARNPMQNTLPQIMNTPHFPRLNHKQKQAIADDKFKQMKKHVKDLAAMVNSLQKEIEKSNPNVLSLKIVKKAKEVQQLAKKIENEAKGD